MFPWTLLVKTKVSRSFVLFIEDDVAAASGQHQAPPETSEATDLPRSQRWRLLLCRVAARVSLAILDRSGSRDSSLLHFYVYVVAWVKDSLILQYWGKSFSYLSSPSRLTWVAMGSSCKLYTGLHSVHDLNWILPSSKPAGLLGVPNTTVQQGQGKGETNKYSRGSESCSGGTVVEQKCWYEVGANPRTIKSHRQISNRHNNSASPSWFKECMTSCQA